MPTTMTRRIAMRRPDGTVRGYLTVPDTTDPVYQAKMGKLLDELDAALDQAAKESGLTREELARALTEPEE